MGDFLIETLLSRVNFHCPPLTAEGLPIFSWELPTYATSQEGKLQEAFQALEEAFGVHARCDSVHPTPLFPVAEVF